jgi:hypothetical protein
MVNFSNLELSFNRGTLSGRDVLVKTHDVSFALVQELRWMNERCGSSKVVDVAQLTIAPSYSSNKALEISVSSRIRPFTVTPNSVALTSMTVYFSSSAPLMERPPAG